MIKYIGKSNTNEERNSIKDKLEGLYQSESKDKSNERGSIKEKEERLGSSQKNSLQNPPNIFDSFAIKNSGSERIENDTMVFTTSVQGLNENVFLLFEIIEKYFR